MTFDQEREHRYRLTERLGILCGSATPTPEQERMAKQEADQWVKDNDEAGRGRDPVARAFKQQQELL